MENSGWIKLHRQIMDTPEWLSEPFTKGQAWVDLLLLANHKTGFIRKRGILVAVERGHVGHSERVLAERWKWSRGKVRRFIAELINVSRISRKIATETVSKNTSVSDLIYIINYEKYQSDSTNDGTENSTENGTRTRMKRMKRNIYPENISELQTRYTDQELIDQAFQAISSTRKTGRIADTVKFKILDSWNHFPVNQIQAGIKTYLEKECFKQGKKEEYLLGIIRNIQTSEIRTAPAFKSTGSKTLDDYYRQTAEGCK